MASELLSQLGVSDATSVISDVSDGSSSHVSSESGSVVLLRTGKLFDVFVLRARSDCPVPSLRALLETAVLPLSDDYAARIGVAFPERDALRKRIREASVALDVIAKGRLVSVSPPKLPVNSQVNSYVQNGAKSINDLPEAFVEDLATLNALQANVISWSKEVERLVDISKQGPGAVLSAEEETVFWSSLDSALLSGQQTFASLPVKISLEILARKRRATAFLFDANNSLDGARRKAAGVLTLIQGLPIVALRTADDLQSLEDGVANLLVHIGGKLRMSSFSIERILSLIDALGTDVNHSITRILQTKGGLLSLPYAKFVDVFDACCKLFEAWSKGYDYCRKVARESAIKKGESMPPRVRSPLSKLYHHLSDLHELRANHHAIGTVLMQLSPGEKNASNHKLDYAFGHLLEECKNLDHFNLSKDDELVWANARLAYTKEIQSVEEGIAKKYRDVLDQRHDLESLALDLRPFECVLEKPFMAEATADATGTVLRLALADFKIIKDRERRLNIEDTGKTSRSVPRICIQLSESRLLRSRMSAILKRLEQVSGRTQLSVTPDLRDFVSEVEKFREYVDPATYLEKWLPSIDLRSFNKPILKVEISTKGQPRLEPSINSNVVWFFRVVRLAKEERYCNMLLGQSHLDFARKSKPLLPLYSQVVEAIDNFNNAAEYLTTIASEKYLRIRPYIDNQWNAAKGHVEKGFSLCWDSITLDLQEFITDLHETCFSLWNVLQALQNADDALETCVNHQLLKFRPVFDEASLTSESQTLLTSFLLSLQSEYQMLGQLLGESQTDHYIEVHWSPRINAALTSVSRKLTTFWISSVLNGFADVPKVRLEATLNIEGNLHLAQYPSTDETELLLYGSLSRTYEWFTGNIRATLGRCHALYSNYSENGATPLQCFFSQEHRIGVRPGLLSTIEPINDVIKDISAKANEWNRYLGVLKTEISEINPKSKDCRDRPVELLRFLSQILEDVNSLQDENDQLVKTPIRFDSRALGNRISSFVRHTISLFCDEIAHNSAGESQIVYQQISKTISQLNASLSDDGSKTLVLLQGVKEEVLPSSKATITRLTELEVLFDNIAKATADPSLAKPEATETWVLSETLLIHFQALSDLLERRSSDISSNHEFLSNTYRKCKEEYDEKFSRLFRDFQSIRGEGTNEETFIDSEHLLLDLEHQLFKLDGEAHNIEIMGRALEIPPTAEFTGPNQLLCEVRRVRNGIKQLSSIRHELDDLSSIEFAQADPIALSEKLSNLLEDAIRVEKSTGAKREGSRHVQSIQKYMKGLTLLSGLFEVALSPPREREFMQRVFGEANAKEGRFGKLPLGRFLEADLPSHQSYLKTVLESAAGEASISDFMSGIEAQWVGRKGIFSFQDDTPILMEIPELLDDLEENLQALGTMKASEFARLFESERSNWESRLAKLRENLEVLIDVQGRWAHLRTLFSSQLSSNRLSAHGDLQEEYSAFSSVHVRFSTFGELLKGAPGVLEGMEQAQGLEDMADELQEVVRGLSRYLERQRSKCPRFFFLSDDDLLQVLSVTTSGVEEILPHIGKLFPGVSTFNYEKRENSVFVSDVVSKEGEALLLTDPICFSEGASVSSWLLRMESSISSALKSMLPIAIQRLEITYAINTPEMWPKLFEEYSQFPAQIGLLALRICFVRFVEKTLESLSKSSTSILLGDVLDLVENLLCGLTASQDEKPNGTRLFLLRGQLIKELIYQRDLTKTLVDEGVRDSFAHEWDHELRPYFDFSSPGESKLIFKCGSGSFEYGWEYLGIGDTLVHTSLTSKCYLAQSECLRRGFGGSPFGPAGTGKTETVKAFGRSLGRHVAVFNCDESFDSISVGRILAGACRLGCWVCFDEFNRLSASILSSTSGQLAVLQDAIRQGSKEVSNFYGGDVPIGIKSGIGVFVTMNPSYSGRQQLPANLKNLFRPCSMSKPDIISIAEVLLLTQGFKSSAALSRKLVEFFRHLKAVLNERPQYDFGLRALKSTIIACGSLIASSHHRSKAEVNISRFEENIVVRGIAEVVKPKLESADVSEYSGALATVFTQADCLNLTLPEEVENAVVEIVDNQGLLPSTSFMEKIRELYWLIQHQSGLILVGDTGSGKTTVWKTLFEASKKLVKGANASAIEGQRGPRLSVTVLDPKLLSVKQIYGYLDPITREWHDGLFTRVLREIIEQGIPSNNEDYPLHWIVFDGDVDPVWAESLNSVLDDNRILTLPSGEQLPLLRNTRIIIETDELRHANPSTVSRCGMICFGNAESVEERLSSSILALIRESCPLIEKIDCLVGLMQIIVEIGREYLKSSNTVMKVPYASITNALLKFCHNSMTSYMRNSYIEKSDPLQSGSVNETDLKSGILRILLVSAVKAVGGGLLKSERLKFSQTLVDRAVCFSEIKEAFHGTAIPPDLGEVIVGSDGQFVEYSEFVSSHRDNLPASDIGNPDVVIQTASTVRLTSLISDSLSLESRKWEEVSCLILCGPPGCGKSMILNSALRKATNISLSTISFSSETTPDNILAALRVHTSISKRPNGTLVLHPKLAGCRVVLFCDEVNLEKPDSYDSQPCIALLRSIIERGGFFDNSSLKWIEVEGLQLVAACNPEGDAGRHKLPSRFLRHCNVIRVEQPSASDLKIIYGEFIRSLLKHVHKGLLDHVKNLTSAMVEFFIRNKEKFSPDNTGPCVPHYVYSPRELSRWVRGMSQLLVDNEIIGGNDENLSPFNIDGPASTAWKDVVSAFSYEARRLFIDRLLAPEERSFSEKALLDVASENLSCNSSWLIDTLYSSWMGQIHSKTAFDTRFRVVRNLGEFRTLIYQKLRLFAEEEGLGGSWLTGTPASTKEDYSPMIDQFAVTDDVLTHLTRIERILSNPLGHAVLMGSPGTGKKTLTRFAAWMLGIEVHQVRSHSGYSEQDFAKDLRRILRVAGVDNIRVVMIFDESHALESGFLEMMNSLLACGEVPGLFSNEERLSLLEDLRSKVIVGKSGSGIETNLYAEFVRRVRNNLHIVFTFSSLSSERQSNASHNSSGDTVITRRSPALYNRCTVNWIGDWTSDTLEAVADLKIEVSLGTEKDQMVRSAVQIHERTRKYFLDLQSPVTITPRHYLEFVEQVNRIVLEKGGAIQTGVERHTEGLERLKEAGAAVDDLKEALEEKTVRLHEKEANANETLKRMVEEQRHAEKSKVCAEQLAQAAAESSDSVLEREQEVSYQLADVFPKVEAAKEAVGSIRKEYLEELRAMPNPPASVKLAMEGVLMILDAAQGKPMKAYTWGLIRGKMRGSEFINSVVEFDPEAVSRDSRHFIDKKIVQNPKYDVDKIAYASRAAGPLAEWTLAVLEYAAVVDSIEPLQVEIAELQEEQDELKEQQRLAVEEVQQYEVRIDKCKSEYAELVAQAEKVRREIKESEQNLDKAEQMLDSLADEWDRWVKDLNCFNASAVTVWGNAMFGAAFLAYAGALDSVHRKHICQSWRGILMQERIPFQEDMDICSYLTSAKERGFWSTTGLPTDSTSLENYAILKRSARYALIVDSSRSISHLLEKIVADPLKAKQQEGAGPAGRLSISSFSSRDSTTIKKSYIRTLESSMRFGTAILLEDSERFDRVVAPLLGQESSYGDAAQYVQSLTAPSASNNGKRTSRNICRRVVRLGQKDVFLSSSFRLYMSAAQLNNVPQAAVTRSNVVSFELSPEALGITCVTKAMEALTPELEEKRRASVAVQVHYEEKKTSLEEEVLSAVTNVDDLGVELLRGTLLEKLSTLKEGVRMMQEKQEEERQASALIKEREHYLEPLAEQAISVFSVLQSLLHLHTLYVFDTSKFLDIFAKSLQGLRSMFQKDDDLHVSQVALLKKSFAETVSSLFPKDRLPFAAALSLITCRYNPTGGGVSSNEVRNILSAWRCALATDSVAGQLHGRDTCLNALPPRLKTRYEASVTLNNRLSESTSSVDAALSVLHASLQKPEEISNSLDMLACSLPEKAELVHNDRHQPQHKLESVITTFSASFSRQGTPPARHFPLLLWSKGSNSDPATLTNDIANRNQLSVVNLAMGSEVSSNRVADIMFMANRKADAGRAIVIILKNMHLATRSAIEQIETEVTTQGGQLPFLLVVVAEVTSGLKGNFLLRATTFFRVLAFQSLPSFRENFFEAAEQISAVCHASHTLDGSFPPEFAKLRVLLSWFHACLLERSANSPIGFSKQYEFSNGDLLSAWDIVEHEASKQSEPAKYLRSIGNLLVTSCYGCRLEHDTDCDVMKALVRDTFNEERFNRSSENGILVSGDRSHGLLMPLGTKELQRFAKKLPLEPKPEWCHMPSRTTLKKHARDGRSALAATLKLCEKAIGAESERIGESAGHANEMNAKNLLGIVKRISPVSIIADEKSEDDALSRFWRMEGRIVNDTVQTMLQDLTALTSQVSGGRFDERLIRLQNELEALSENGDRNVPKVWRECSPVFNRCKSIDKMFSLLSQASQCVNEALLSASARRRELNLSSVLRPEALLSALRFDFAASSKEDVYSVLPVVTKGSRTDGWTLRGIRMSGARWDSAGNCFVVSDEEVDDESLSLTWQSTGNEKGLYSVPLYRDVGNSTILTNVLVPASRESSLEQWRLRGVSFSVLL